MNEESNQGEINETGTEQVAGIELPKEITEKKDWHREALIYASTPETLREQSVTDFCKEYGISRVSYYNFVKKDTSIEIIKKNGLDKALLAFPDIVNTLIQKAKDGNDKSIDQYLDYIAKLSKNIDLTSGGKAIPIYGGFSRHIIDKTDIQPKEED